MTDMKWKDHFEAVRAQLSELGLFDRRSLVMLRQRGGRVVLNAEGKRVAPTMFEGVTAELAVLTAGRYALQYAALGKPVTASTDDMAMMFGHRVRCVDRPDGGDAAYIIRGRGFLVTGRFESELIAACILMEKMCKAELLAPAAGKVRHLNPALSALEHSVYMKKYSKNEREASAADGGSAQENAAAAEAGASQGAQADAAAVPDRALREAVIRYGQLLIENRLIQSTWGNVSARIDEHRFLITPSGVDYYRIRPEEILEINIDDGSYAEGLHPSSERRLHLLIYQERPDIGAIIHTHASNCQVLAACHADLKADGLDYPCAAYGVSGSGKLAANVVAVMRDHDGCIMANHGFVTGAATLEQALDQAVRAEAAAGAFLGTGELRTTGSEKEGNPMSDNFAKGRSAEIFNNGDGKITKLFFADYSRDYAEKEYRNTKVAADLGCTDMKVYDMVEQDGRYGFVMDYVDGVSQNDLSTKKPSYFLRGGKDLARCHVRIQAKHTKDLDDIRAVCSNLLADPVMDFLTTEEKVAARQYILSLPEEDTVLHLDLHTGNVLVDQSGNCYIIDWVTAARGNRAVEEALMEFLFSEAELFPEASPMQLKVFRAVRGFVGKQFFKEYQKLTPISAEEIERYRLLALIFRRSWNIEVERPYLTKTIRAYIRKECMK